MSILLIMLVAAATTVAGYGVLRQEPHDIDAFNDIVVAALQMSPEMAEVTHRVASELAKRSPKWDVSYYSCRRGKRGVPGMMGQMGENDMPEWTTVDEVREGIFQGMVNPARDQPFNCNIDRAVELAIKSILKAVPWGPTDTSYPEGPPGIMGKDGEPLSETIRTTLGPMCFASKAAAITTWYLPECEFTAAIAEVMAARLRETTINALCPVDLEGPPGPAGMQGEPYTYSHPVFRDPNTWKKLAQMICPDTYGSRNVTTALID